MLILAGRVYVDSALAVLTPAGIAGKHRQGRVGKRGFEGYSAGRPGEFLEPFGFCHGRVWDGEGKGREGWNRRRLASLPPSRPPSRVRLSLISRLMWHAW